MTIKKTAFAIALLALALTACSKNGEEGHTEGGHAEGEAPKSSSAGLPTGNIEAGMKLATTKRNGFACVDCHGAEGNAPLDKVYPKLGGQYSDYIEHALLAYRKGDREHALMGSQAKSLTDQQIADLGAYFQSAPAHLKDLHGAE